MSEYKKTWRGGSVFFTGEEGREGGKAAAGTLLES